MSEVQKARDNQDSWINLPQPRNYEECQRRPDAILFQLAFLKEVGAFEKLKVMSFGHTKSQVKAWGVDGSPVPLLVLPSVKINPDGSYDKHKIRICLCGSPFFMTKGVHYTHTYAATVDISSIRLLSVIALLLNWGCKSWDIATAYLHDAGTGIENIIDNNLFPIQDLKHLIQSRM
jgi:hypothetical protein